MPKVLPLGILVLLSLSGCVSRIRYDALQTKNWQLQEQNWQLQAQNTVLAKQVVSQKAQVNRLHRTVNSTVSALEQLTVPADKVTKEHSPE